MEHNVNATIEWEEVNMEHHHHNSHGISEVQPEVSYRNGELVIALTDKNGDAPELKVSHEKIMHLFVMSDHLGDYHHLHPEGKGDGLFTSNVNLPDGNYKVFVDINPKGLDYTVKPVPISVGEAPVESPKNHLNADTTFTKTINGQTVELITGAIEAHKEVTFTFDVKNAKPEPYLGALGHVVITDERGEKFIHVHPVSNHETVFNTQFEEQGTYKMWAEFKIDGEVIVYPFIFDVQ